MTRLKEQTILQLDKVSKFYERRGRRLAALNDISLELYGGDFVGIFGASGSGKTTLLRIAAGMLSPDRGAVTFQGKRLDQLPRAERRIYQTRKVGCIWGEPRLLPGLNVLDSVSMPLLIAGTDRRSATQRAHEVLMACNAGHCIEIAPHELSDGERQRVAIAQALVTEPQLVLADCPVANLDLVEQDSILALFQSLAKEAGVAVLITDTNATGVLRASDISYLRDGRLISDSVRKPAEVVGLDGTRAGRRR